MEMFYDSTVMKAPKTRKQLAESNYVDVRFSDTESSLMALPSFDHIQNEPPVISVPNFSSLAPMIKGTDRLTTQLAAMKLGLLKELDVGPPAL